jgi:DNA-binding IclR family transcriptional regulator
VAETENGSKTLARGLRALRLVVASPAGLGVTDLAARLGVHRTIAYRMLQTLAEAGLVTRATDGSYRGSVGLLQLQPAGYAALRRLAAPIAQAAANDLAATVSVLVAEGPEAIAVVVAAPVDARYRIIFSEGSTHPLTRGAAGHALAALAPASPDDPPTVSLARQQGWARSFAEVEPGAHGVAVPVPVQHSDLRACVNLITYREDIADAAVERLIDAARELAHSLDAALG